MAITKATASSIAPAAKGDLVVGNATNDAAVLAVGADGTTLVADSAEATGLKWATPAAGGMTLIQEQTASSSTGIDFTSISGSYKQLLLVWNGIFQSNSSTVISIRLNNDSNNNYYYMSGAFRGSSQNVEAGAVSDITDGANGLSPLGYGITSTVLQDRGSGYLVLDNYASTTKLKNYYGMFKFRYSTTNYFDSFFGTYDSTSAITQLNIVRQQGTGTFSNATNTSIRLYGIS
jgi:hypothetical protein